MDGLSGAATVAAIATIAAQLSKALFEAYSTVKGAEDEIRDIANNVSLLALVLAEMEECLCENSSFFQPSLEQTALTIAERCESIFKDIERDTGVQRGKTIRKGLAARLGWFFKKDRVKLLRVSLESLKSTLNVLLQLVVLARLSTDTQIQGSDVAGGNRELRKERRALVSLVVDNFLAIDRLEKAEEVALTDLPISEEQPKYFEDSFSPSTVKYEAREEAYVHSPSGREEHGDHWSEERGSPYTKSNIQEPGSFRPSFPWEIRSDSFIPQDSDPAERPPIELRDNEAPHFKPQPLQEPFSYQPSGGPRTSEILLSAIPHKTRSNPSYRGSYSNESQSLEERAEGTVDSLLQEYSYVTGKVPWNAQPPRTAQSSPTVELPYEPPYEPHNPQPRPSGGPAKEPGDRPHYMPSAHYTQPYERYAAGTVPSFTNLPHQPYNSKTAHEFRNRTDQRTNDQSIPNEIPGYSQYEDVPQTPEAPDTPSEKPRSRERFRRHRVSFISSDSESDSERVRTRSRGPSQISTSRSKGRHRKDEDEHEVRLRAMEVADKFMGWLSRPRVELGIMEDRYRRLEEEVRLKRAVEEARKEAFSAVKEEHTQQLALENAAEKAKPVIFKDGTGRKFCLPIESCKTWQAMESLLANSFSNNPSMNAQILGSKFDIVGRKIATMGIRNGDLR